MNFLLQNGYYKNRYDYNNLELFITQKFQKISENTNNHWTKTKKYSNLSFNTSHREKYNRLQLESFKINNHSFDKDLIDFFDINTSTYAYKEHNQDWKTINTPLTSLDLKNSFTHCTYNFIAVSTPSKTNILRIDIDIHDISSNVTREQVYWELYNTLAPPTYVSYSPRGLHCYYKLTKRESSKYLLENLIYTLKQKDFPYFKYLDLKDSHTTKLRLPTFHSLANPHNLILLVAYKNATFQTIFDYLKHDTTIYQIPELLSIPELNTKSFKKKEYGLSFLKKDIILPTTHNTFIFHNGNTNNELLQYNMYLFMQGYNTAQRYEIIEKSIIESIQYHNYRGNLLKNKRNLYKRIQGIETKYNQIIANQSKKEYPIASFIVNQYIQEHSFYSEYHKQKSITALQNVINLIEYYRDYHLTIKKDNYELYNYLCSKYPFYHFNLKQNKIPLSSKLFYNVFGHNCNKQLSYLKKIGYLSNETSYSTVYKSSKYYKINHYYLFPNLEKNKIYNDIVLKIDNNYLNDKDTIYIYNKKDIYVYLNNNKVKEYKVSIIIPILLIGISYYMFLQLFMEWFILVIYLAKVKWKMRI